MTNILYPTRGGQASYPNQDRVIALAKERAANLYFLYVSNVEFLGTVARPALVDIVEDELEHMGEFLLAMAQERAEKAGWTAEGIIRRGDFRAALDEVIEAHEIDLLVLGAPGKDHAMTTPKFLRALMESVAEQHGIEVIVLTDGEITDQLPPPAEAGVSRGDAP